VVKAARAGRRGYAPAVRRLLAILALASLLSAPVMSRTQHLCRYSGEELSCAADTSAPTPILMSESCCERRQWTALAQMRAASSASDLGSPLLLPPLETMAAVPSPKPELRALAVPLRASGPPLFVQHRALLI